MLHELERNGFLFHYLFLGLLDVILDFHAKIIVVFQTDHLVVNLDIVVDNLDFVRKDRDLWCLWWRWRGLLGDRNNLLLDELLLVCYPIVFCLILAGPLKCAECNKEGKYETDLSEQQSLVVQTGFF